MSLIAAYFRPFDNAIESILTTYIYILKSVPRCCTWGLESCGCNMVGADGSSVQGMVAGPLEKLRIVPPSN